MSNYKQISYDFVAVSTDRVSLEDAVGAFLHTIILQRSLDNPVQVVDAHFASTGLCYARVEHPVLTRQVQDQVRAIVERITTRAPNVYVLSVLLYPRDSNQSSEGRGGTWAFAKSLLPTGIFSAEPKAPPLEMWTLKIHARDAVSTYASTAKKVEMAQCPLLEMVSYLTTKGLEEVTEGNLEGRPPERYELVLGTSHVNQLLVNSSSSGSSQGSVTQGTLLVK